MEYSLGSVVERGRLIPSFLVGSYRQTAAGFDRPGTFTSEGGTPLVLVPGAFCTSGVMNRLAGKLSGIGFSVHLPKPFPYWFGPLANAGRLDRAARQFIDEMLDLSRRTGIDSIWCAGHSNGGLIVLMALDIAEQEGRTEFLDLIAGLVTMATPFGGTDVAVLAQYVVPCCRDIVPERSPALERVVRQYHRIRACLQSTGDFLVPPPFQVPPGVEPVRMDGFQHMDFLVGSDDRIQMTADAIKEAIHG